DPPITEAEQAAQDSSKWKIKGQWLNIEILERSCKTELQEGRPDVVYEQRARALIIWCIGSFIFPDQLADGVSLYWLQLLEDFDGIKGYNWGSALLAGVYRALATSFVASEKKVCLILCPIVHWERGNNFYFYLIRTLFSLSNFVITNFFSVILRWVGPRSRSNIATRLAAYRDQFTGLREDE
ncbi:Unknown protein, partial [Striga hermonthica]